MAEVDDGRLDGGESGMTKAVANDNDSSAAALVKQPMLTTPPEGRVPGSKCLTHSHDGGRLSCCCLIS